MKIASLLAGVAAVALTATAASAGPNIYQAAATVGPGPNGPVVQINTATPAAGWYLEPGDNFNNTQAVPVAGGQNFPASASTEMLQGLAALGIHENSNQNIAMIQITGGAADNNGTASTTAGATFTLKGNVTKDCAYYTGNASTSVDFGTIGIYASDSTGPAAAFDMTAPATVSIDTNLAGCNTSNTVTVSKSSADGLVNSNTGVGYDGNVFQANLPYTVKGTYTAGAVGAFAATSGAWIDISETALDDAATHGAWKSAMSLKVNIPVPSKSLLAGDYTGDLIVSIAAF